MKKTSLHILPVFVLATTLLFIACEKKLRPADVEITDPVRHYYPIVQGEQLKVNYEIENNSDEPLFIQEIQTTCGCLVPHGELPIVVLPGKRNSVRLIYNSIKNTGMVEHYVWLYGNFTDSNYRELRFDTNVVPPADYTRDYETLWHEQITNTGSLKDMVDGYSSDKGYYIDNGIDPREQSRIEVQRKVDEFAF